MSLTHCYLQCRDRFTMLRLRQLATATCARRHARAMAAQLGVPLKHNKIPVPMAWPIRMQTQMPPPLPVALRCLSTASPPSSSADKQDNDAVTTSSNSTVCLFECCMLFVEQVGCRDFAFAVGCPLLFFHRPAIPHTNLHGHLFLLIE